MALEFKRFQVSVVAFCFGLFLFDFAPLFKYRLLPFQSTHPQGLGKSGFRDTAGGCITPQAPPPIALGLLAGSSALARRSS